MAGRRDLVSVVEVEIREVVAVHVRKLCLKQRAVSMCSEDNREGKEDKGIGAWKANQDINPYKNKSIHQEVVDKNCKHKCSHKPKNGRCTDLGFVSQSSSLFWAHEGVLHREHGYDRQHLHMHGGW